MARDVNLTSNEWCELVFEGKNKSYGAYYLRKSSSKRHFRALLIVMIIAAILIFLPTLIDKIIPEKGDGPIEDVVKITEVNVEDDKPIEQPVDLDVPPPPALMEAIKFVPPVIDKNATDDDVMKTQDEVVQSKAIIFTQDIDGSKDDGAIDPRTLDVVKTITQPTEAPKPQILTIAEQMPEFPGGPKEMMRWLSANLKYPQIAIENGIQGRVTIRFAVSATGAIDGIEVTGPVDRSLDEEAVRLVKSMPKWIPGRQNGKNVAVYYNLPVVFRLQE